ncbi:coiled coils domain protein [Pacmanvirus S19]|nr:coiled coils domain protein [Pacmanvirus S19]
MDIYSDLKKFAGIIKATKVVSTVESVKSEVIEEQNKLQQNLQQKTKQRVKTEEKQNTIDEIAAMIKEPMIPLKDANGFIHDSVTIAVKCQSNHIHKYFLSDIVSGSVIKCLTCSSGNKFTKAVRDIIEAVFMSSFIFNESKIDKDSNSVEYVNRIYKVAISCHRTNIKDSICQKDNYLLIKISPTTSQKKIKDIIGELLSQYKDTFPVEVQNNINELSVKLKKITLNFNNFNKEPLPFTPELIKMNIAHTRIDPEIANKRLNILENDKLYFDNC